MSLKILVACEFSGTVRDAFIAKGHQAVSCDLLPTESPGPHIVDDVSKHLNNGWDLMIAHPPCTYLTCTAEWAYKDPPHHQKVLTSTLTGQLRRDAREKALDFVRLLMDAPIEKIAIENPIGVISKRIRQPDQYIHPYEYGHDASKKTCLWLKNLEPLEPTQFISPRLQKLGKSYQFRWSNQTPHGQDKTPPSADRWKIRSMTYQGWADAMADKWG